MIDHDRLELFLLPFAFNRPDIIRSLILILQLGHSPRQLAQKCPQHFEVRDELLAILDRSRSRRCRRRRSEYQSTFCQFDNVGQECHGLFRPKLLLSRRGGGGGSGFVVESSEQIPQWESIGTTTTTTASAQKLLKLIRGEASSRCGCEEGRNGQDRVGEGFEDGRRRRFGDGGGRCGGQEGLEWEEREREEG